MTDDVLAQAYETRAEFGRQRASITGINTRMSNVICTSLSHYRRNLAHRDLYSDNAWHQQSSWSHPHATATRCGHHGRHIWNWVYLDPYVSLGLIAAYHMRYLFRCLSLFVILCSLLAVIMSIFPNLNAPLQSEAPFALSAVDAVAACRIQPNV
jgi:hypothetical protein